MNVRIFRVRPVDCMCTQTRPRSILSSERVLVKGVRTHVNSKGKTPLPEAQKRFEPAAPASRRTASPTHCRLSCSAPPPPFSPPSPSPLVVQCKLFTICSQRRDLSLTYMLTKSPCNACVNHAQRVNVGQLELPSATGVEEAGLRAEGWWWW